MLAILFEELPDWAQEDIVQAVPGNITQIQSKGHSLSINEEGVIRFDGQRVILPKQDPNMYADEPTEIAYGKLPHWVKVILREKNGANTNMCANGDSLNITNGVVIYNGMLVI